MDLANAKCKDCVFYACDEFEQDEVTYTLDYGQCRRYPPKRIAEELSGFPMVEETWSCGEFKPE